MQDKYNRQLYTYDLPQDLLDPPLGTPHHHLEPFNVISLPEPAWAVTVYPSFSLEVPNQCLYLASVRDMPVRLLSPFTPSILASYPLVYHHKERWVTPNCLLFHPRDPTMFFAGGIGAIHLFDINRDGEPPYRNIMRPSLKGVSREIKALASMAGQGDDDGPRHWPLKGIVSAMDMNSEGLLAAGTFSKDLAILDPDADSTVVTRLFLPQDESGITGLKFHPSASSGNYLVAGSRRSKALHVFDIRNPRSVLARLTDRICATSQRVEFDITDEGEVWAGCTDGKLRMWERLGLEEGDVAPSWEREMHHDPIEAVELHPRGAPVVATCGGPSQVSRLVDKKQAEPWEQEISDSQGSDVSDGELNVEDQTNISSTLQLWQFALNNTSK